MLVFAIWNETKMMYGDLYYNRTARTIVPWDLFKTRGAPSSKFEAAFLTRSIGKPSRALGTSTSGRHDGQDSYTSTFTQTNKIRCTLVWGFLIRTVHLQS